MCTNDAGVYLSLGGTKIANNSFVDIDSIGSNDTSALLCHTNKLDCCNYMSLNETEQGNWYFDNGTAHEEITATNTSNMLFVSNRGQGVIRLLLNHLVDNNTETMIGHFYCLISDANGTDHTIHVNICELL